MTQNDGAATVVRHWFEALRGLGFAVTVLGFDFRDHRWGEDERAALRSAGATPRIVPWAGAAPGSTMRRLLALGLPLLSGNRFVPERIGLGEATRCALDEAIGTQGFDVAVFHGVDTLHMVGPHRLRAVGGVRLLDLHDVMPRRIVQMQRALARMMWQGAIPQRADLVHALALRSERMMARAEAKVISGANLVCCASGEELDALRSWGIDPRRLRRIWWPIAAKAACATRQPAFDLGLLASDALFNRQGLRFFLHDVWPLIRLRQPGCRLALAGSICRDLERVKLPAGVTALGWIDDVATFYADVSIVTVPLRSGTGVSIKTLEAAAYGAAIVSTPIGIRGLDLVAGEEVLVGEDAAAFAERCLELLADGEGAAAMGRAAQRRVRERHDTRVFTARIGSLIDEARGILVNDRAACA